jgi:hypothetical protein
VLELGTVAAWDTAAGSGRLARGNGLDDLCFERSALGGGSDIEVGERVAFDLDYERLPGADDYSWQVRSVRVVTEEDAAAIELETLCETVEHADSRLSAAQDLASDDDVESARESWSRAYDTMRKRVPEIGRELFARGGSDQMRAILSRVPEKHRSTITTEWEGIGS